MRTQRTHLIIVAMISLGWPVLGHAQSASSASAEADLLFDQGRTLMEAGRLAEACGAFDASQRLSPAVSTLFNQAQCREQNNQLATAYGLFREAERQTRAPLDAATQKLNRVAIDRAKLLEPRLSRLTIAVAADHHIDQLEVLRGDAVVDPGGWNRALPIDGGTYTIVARAPGRVPWQATINVSSETDAKTIEVPELELSPRSQAKRSKLIPVLFAGGAVALLGTGLGFELSARGDYNLSRIEPNNTRQASLFESAKTKRYVAQGLAVAGVGAAGVAVWLYLRGDRDGEETEPRLIARIGNFNVDVVLVPHQTGFQLTRNF